MILSLCLIVAAAAVVLFWLDRLALWMEKRGWIYYRRRRSPGGIVSSAILEAQAMVEPEKRHLIEVQREEREEERPSGDPPEPGVR